MKQGHEDHKDQGVLWAVPVPRDQKVQLVYQDPQDHWVLRGLQELQACQGLQEPQGHSGH